MKQSPAKDYNMQNLQQIVVSLRELSKRREEALLLRINGPQLIDSFHFDWELALEMAQLFGELHGQSFAKKMLLKTFKYWCDWPLRIELSPVQSFAMYEALKRKFLEIEKVPSLKLTAAEHMDLFYYLNATKCAQLKIS